MLCPFKFSKVAVLGEGGVYFKGCNISPRTLLKHSENLEKRISGHLSNIIGNLLTWNFRKTYLLAEFWPPVYFLGIIWLFLCLAGLFWVNPTISGLFCVNRTGFPFSRPAFPPLSGCLASLLTTPSSPPSSRTLPAPMLAVSTRWGWGAGEKNF